MRTGWEKEKFPFFSIIALSLIVVGAFITVQHQNEKRKLASNPNQPVKIYYFTEINGSEADQALRKFDPRLLAKITEKRAKFLTAYRLDEGVQFWMSAGTYAVFRGQDGQYYWLINAILVLKPTVTTIQAVALVTEKEWRDAMMQAKKEKLELPSARTLIPSRFIQKQETNELYYRGEPF